MLAGREEAAPLGFPDKHSKWRQGHLIIAPGIAARRAKTSEAQAEFTTARPVGGAQTNKGNQIRGMCHEWQIIASNSTFAAGLTNQKLADKPDLGFSRFADAALFGSRSAFENGSLRGDVPIKADQPTLI